MKIDKIFLVSHTNWDREWYLDYEKYRFRMVETLDKLLEIFDNNPHFRHFTWDGHTIFLEDYLQIRPYKKEKVKKYIQQGRLHVGPWYTMPDEFLASGESLIRNLLIGTRMAKEYGQVMRVGFLVDTFGHISQMPQILKGFNIHKAIVWRGVGNKLDKLEFKWKSPDGSSVLTTHLAHHKGYSNIPNIPSDKQEFINIVRNFRAKLSPHTETGCILLMNGGDYSEPQEHLSEILKQLDYRVDESELIHGTISSYMNRVRETNPPIKIWQGEFYSPKKAILLQDVRSTRIHIKQKNREVENLLEKWAEPIASWAWLLGKEYPQSFLAQAWKYLLQCHLHDPICGSCADEVEEAMKHRFYQAQIIGEEVAEKGIRFICNCINTNKVRKNETIPLVVFNSLNGIRTDYMETSVWYPGDIQNANIAIKNQRGNPVPCQIGEQKYKDISSLKFTGENISQLQQRVQGLLYEIQGNIAERLKVVGIEIKDGLKEQGEIELFLYPARDDLLNLKEITLAQIMKKIKSYVQQSCFDILRLNVKLAQEVPVLFLAEQLVGPGYEMYLLEKTKIVPSFPEEIYCSSYCLENQWYKVVVNKEDGSVDIEDKSTGIVYKKCNQFFDEGDAGDTHSFCSPDENSIVKRPLSSPKTHLMEKGPVRATIKIDIVLTLPCGLSKNRNSRSAKKVSYPITVYLSIYSRIKRIDFRVEVENRATDHRLRVHFPTPIKTEYSFAESIFDVVKRPINTPDGENWVEKPSGIYPQQDFVDINNGEEGMALANKGLPEFQIIRGPGGATIILTLLRCIGRLGRSDLSCRKGGAGPLLEIPRAQCLGKYCFRYSLIPHEKMWLSSLTHKYAHEFEVPLRAYQTDFHSGWLPLQQNLIAVEPDTLVVSAIQKSENGERLIVRIYNLADEQIRGKVALYVPFGKANLVNLDEEEVPEGDLVKDNAGRVQILLPAKSIKTIKFTLEK